MGRPPLAQSRTAILYVRLTPEENRRIRAAAASDGAVEKKEFADWVRAALLATPSPTTDAERSTPAEQTRRPTTRR